MGEGHADPPFRLPRQESPLPYSSEPHQPERYVLSPFERAE